MASTRFHVKKGDNVQVITGNHKGFFVCKCNLGPCLQRIDGRQKTGIANQSCKHQVWFFHFGNSGY